MSPRGSNRRFVHTWTLPHAFNSVDHKALWWWLWEFNVCQTLRAHYEADLPYEKTALTWHKAGRQTVSIAFLPYLERPLFGVEGSGYRSQDRYWPADLCTLLFRRSSTCRWLFCWHTASLWGGGQILRVALDECQDRKVRHLGLPLSQEAPPCLAVRLSTSRGG